MPNNLFLGVQVKTRNRKKLCIYFYAGISNLRWVFYIIFKLTDFEENVYLTIMFAFNQT